MRRAASPPAGQRLHAPVHRPSPDHPGCLLPRAVDELLRFCSLARYPADKESLMRGVVSLHTATDSLFMAVEQRMRVCALHMRDVRASQRMLPRCAALPQLVISPACTGLLHVPVPVQSVTAPCAAICFSPSQAEAEAREVALPAHPGHMPADVARWLQQVGQVGSAACHGSVVSHSTRAAGAGLATMLAAARAWQGRVQTHCVAQGLPAELRRAYPYRRRSLCCWRRGPRARASRLGCKRAMA